jgi:hypothetical protein
MDERGINFSVFLNQNWYLSPMSFTKDIGGEVG